MAIGKDQPVDMVEVRVGEGNRPNPVDSDVRFAQRLRKQAHAWVPSVRRARIDQRDIGSIVPREGID